MEIAIVVNTLLMLFAFMIFILAYIRTTGYKKYEKFMRNNEYAKAIDLLEQDKYKTIFMQGHHLNLAYLYFINNDYDNYIKAKEKSAHINIAKDDDSYLWIVNSSQIIEIILMYLHEDINGANVAYEKLIKDNDELEKKSYFIHFGTWRLLKVLEMIYLYYNSNYDKAKLIYEYISSYTKNNTVRTLVSYYACKIYEIEGNYEAIKAIIADIDIQNNPYGIYLDKWRAKQ
ncbi:MAG: hypothetical protein GYA50_02715 [Eubacteriaceae bacterium]|nr:hypothetical protein [Eubacteriaceae bacterium]